MLKLIPLNALLTGMHPAQSSFAATGQVMDIRVWGNRNFFRRVIDVGFESLHRNIKVHGLTK